MMGVILGEAAHTHQAMQHAGAFVAVDRAFFSIAQRQVAVGAQAVLVDMQMERAVHRFKIILLPFDIDWRVHVFFIKTEVTAGLPQAGFADMGGVDKVIPIGKMLVFPVAFRQASAPWRLWGATGSNRCRLHRWS